MGKSQMIIDTIHPRKLYTIPELMELTGYCYDTFIRAIHRKNLKAYKHRGGNRWMIKGADFDDFMKAFFLK